MILSTITLNEVEHPVKLGTLAFSILEEKTGIENPFSMLSDTKKLRSARHLQALIYGAIRCGYVLQGEPCPVTYEQVGAFMQPKELDNYVMAVIKTFDVPDVEELEEKTKKKIMKAS